jgi:branched-chain amino acid transport system ATP-binding protein
MDECMAGLTETEASAMMATVREIKTEGIALIVVEHVMRVVMSLCEKIYVINFGKIIAHGTPQEVSDDREVIRAYLGDGEMQEC